AKPPCPINRCSTQKIQSAPPTGQRHADDASAENMDSGSLSDSWTHSPLWADATHSTQLNGNSFVTAVAACRVKNITACPDSRLSTGIESHQTASRTYHCHTTHRIADTIYLARVNGAVIIAIHKNHPSRTPTISRSITGG